MPTFGLRQLGKPVDVSVQANAGGEPQMVRRAGWPRARRVEQILDRWRIDDEWWREQAVSRMYYVLLLENGARVTVFHDLVGGGWFGH